MADPVDGDQAASGGTGSIADRPSTLLGGAGDVVDIAGRWSERCDGAVDTGTMFRWYRLGELADGKKRKGSLRVADGAAAARSAA